MLTGILLFSIMAFIGILSYRRPRLEQRVFKNIPLIDWMNILLLPITMYFAVILIVKNILDRRAVSVLDFDDFSLLSIGVLFLVYAFVGNSIHFVSKVLSRYMPRNHHSLTYQVNEIFHGKLSHYLAFVCSFLSFFILALLEINHPLELPLTDLSICLTIFSGLLVGFSIAKGIFYTSAWFGGYNKPLFSIMTMFLILELFIFRLDHLNFIFYPMNLFFASTAGSFISTFILRQLLIFSRLGKKRRLQFLTKMLSA